MDLLIPDMTCKHCEAAVTRALTAMDAGARVSIDLAARRVSVETSAGAEAVRKALTEAGYASQAV